MLLANNEVAHFMTARDKKIEETLSKKRVAIPAIMVILLNWIWNIYKGL